MSSPQLIADALTRAGGDKLPAPARAYLFRRLTTQVASGEPHTTYNLGGLRDASFGVLKENPVRGEATFPNLDSAARALVAASYREAPRDWGALTSQELAQLGSYPLTRKIAKLGEGPTAEDLVKAAVISLDPSGTLTSVYKPSDEAQTTFVGLLTDFAAFERLKVGENIFAGTKAGIDPHLPNLRPDMEDWRTFRDDWFFSRIPGNEIGGRLTAQTIAANKIRKYLAEAKVVDPLLQTGDRQGTPVDQSTGAIKKAAALNTSVKDVPFFGWLTDPTGRKIDLPLIGPVNNKAFWLTTGAAALLGTLAFFKASHASTHIYLEPREREDEYEEV